MKVPQALLFLLALVTTIHALALPSLDSWTASPHDLFKRKGGGGGGGKGGGSSSSSSSGSSSGSSSSGSSSSSGGTKGSSGSSSSSSGSGARPSYGSNGGYYAGGASSPYRTGATSRGGITPYLIGGAALGFFPGLALYGAYAYPWPARQYTYHNDTTGQNETHPVSCLCAQESQCGCDANNDTTYLNSVANNNTVSRLADVNGTQTLYIDGTEPNGTTAATGGAAGLRQGLLEMSGWWVVLAGVGYTMWFV